MKKSFSLSHSCIIPSRRNLMIMQIATDSVNAQGCTYTFLLYVRVDYSGEASSDGSGALPTMFICTPK